MNSAGVRCAARSVAGSLAGTAVAASLLAAVPPPAGAEEPGPARPTYLGKTHYTGEFHSHTSVSDGVELPPDAFAHVHSETDADFFTVSEHDVMWDVRNGDDFIDDWRDADSAEWRYLHEQTEAFNASQDELVAVPSIENTWYDGTGHINVFNADWHATARATEKGSVDGFGNSFGTGDLKYDMYTFFARLKHDPDAIGQFNHPSPTGKGNFFDFNGLDPVVDDRMELIEVKSAGQLAQYQRALDKGWHVGPVWNGDEHSANWVSGNESITGVWASDHSLDGLYDAMQDRSVYSTQDVNTVLAFGANDQLMGSVLPSGTSTVDVDVALSDPDGDDAFTAVRLITNGGEVAHEFTGVSGNQLDLAVELDVADGDFYYLRADQADGQFVVSAPIWVGETTRGANYAPEITVEDVVPAEASYDDRVALPQVTATDDSGEEPTVTVEVYDGAGLVPVEGGVFRVRSYDDHFVVVKASDATGNIGAELLRITVDQTAADPDGVFQYFGSTATVAEQPGAAGLAVTTDRSIEQVYAQVLPAGSDDWSSVPVLTSTDDRPYEVNTIGNDEPVYQHSITGQTLRSHEFELTGLQDGTRYRYRFGVAVEGAAPRPTDASAWTEVRGDFVAAGADDQPVYVLGDLQAQSHDPADLGLLRRVLDRLETEKPGGGTVVQVGDLVDNGGRGQYWEEVHEHFLQTLDHQLAPVVGNHETYGDPDYNALSGERSAVFSSMFALPENGVIGESSYSFDRGSIHFSVLNSNVDLDQQLAWLVQDVRASTQPWNVVVGHFSYYGGSHADDPGMAVARDRVTATLEQLGVDLYVGGHDHVYKRSVIHDGRLAATPEEEAAGTHFVTMGSSGPKFYDNAVHWWDDVVFDEKTQVGGVLEVTDAGLQVSAYTIDGRPVDSFTITKPRGTWRLSSAEVVDRELAGVGFLSHPGSRDTVTVTAATYDSTQEEMVALRTERVVLDHAGVEQYVELDSPLPVRPSDTVKVFVWDELGSGRPLRPALTLREGLAGDGSAQDPYLVDSADDLAKVANDPAGHYLLTTDLDLGGRERAQLGRAYRFTGVLDGGGHTISGFTALADHGVGLFAENHGTIRDLVLVGHAEAAKSTAGLLVDVNHGTIERVRTEGAITGESRVGGIVGDHHGVVRDSYSTADVRATGLYSGGVVGIAVGGSVTERVYAAGSVTADGRNAGGVVSYGYEETVVRHVVSVNASVSAPSYAHAIVGRVADGQLATLEDNHTSELVPVTGQSLADPPAADNWKGAVAPVGQVRTAAFYEARGWDFADVWGWNEDGRRPVLQVAPEDVEPLPVPNLPTDERGFHVVDSVDDLEQLRQHPSYDYVLAADLDLSGAPFTSLPGPFVGELDGAGHTISGLTSTTGGLFGHVAGSVHDLAVVDAEITSTSARAGILANASSGTIERVRTSGSVTGGSRVGGIVGDSGGVVRDSYTTAAVHSTSTEAGGAIGVALTGSLTERVYAGGAVTADTRNVGGVVGYGYTGTEIRHSVALNPTVVAPSYAHRFLGRVLAGNTATLVDNWASAAVVAEAQAVPAVGPDTLNGATATRAEVRGRAFYADRLGWDFGATWAWDEDGRRPVLRSVPEDVPATPAEPDLPQDGDGAYLLSDPADLDQLAAYPEQDFRLARDLDLSGRPDYRITTAFSGDLDGAGHALTGLTSVAGGLFAIVTGTVHDLTIEGASVETSQQNVGLLVDRNEGLVERVATTGSIRGRATVGGIVGYSCGTIRDSYSTADVTATAGRQAGGVVGIAGGTAQCTASGGSTTERTYATGRVEVVGNQNAGGISGYGYDGTTIRDSIALNAAVVATDYAHRVLARTLAGNSPTLAGNHASAAVEAAVQGVTETGATTLNGETLSADEAAAASTYTDLLGWDLTSVWVWDEGLGRPVLGDPADREVVAPALSRTAPFATTADPGLAHDATLSGDGTATITVTGGAASGGQQLSVVVLPVGADLGQPSAEEVVYLNEVELDEAGDAALSVRLPGGTLADYVVALNTGGPGERYVALLDPDGELPPAGEATVTARPTTVRYGRAATVRVAVVADSGTPTGQVTVRRGGRVLGTGSLREGAAAVRLPPRSLGPRPAPHRLRVVYSGDAQVRAATGPLVVRVAKGRVRVSAAVEPRRVEARRTRARVVLRLVNADGVPVTGRVRVNAPGIRPTTARVVDGRAKVRLPVFRKPGRHRVTVRYGGSRYLVSASTTAVVRVRR